MSKAKIFVYRPLVDDFAECQAMAYAADGTPLAAHYSSNVFFFRGDMGLNGDVGMGRGKHVLYRAKYPDGYDLVEVIGREAMQQFIDAGQVKNLSFENEGAGP